MGLKNRKTQVKNPPIFSQEFFIQNHADIISCIAMVLVIGILVQATSTYAYMFIALQHNLTSLEPADRVANENLITYFTYGWKDLCTVFFYCLICIVMHAIVQEYVIDKMSKKLHILSKAKHSTFNESGQFFIFYLCAVVWGIDIIIRDSYLLNISSLWEGYPHTNMAFVLKFYFITQLSYWLHCYPELYFQKVKREEILERVVKITLYLVFITLAYVTNLTRVGLCLIVLHYISQVFNHLARLVDIVDKTERKTQVAFFMSKVFFVLIRLSSIILSVLTFWYGLALSDKQGFDVATGNFNVPQVRMGALLAVGSLQAYLMWNFITSQLAKMREMSSVQQPLKKRLDKKSAANLKKKDLKKEKKQSEEDVDDLPEVDQNTAKKQKQKKIK